VTRARVDVEGTVQGVGFRPHAHRLAVELQLGGWVRNDERGVELEIEGEQAAVQEFLKRLREEAPPRARVEQVRVESRSPLRERDFHILPSTGDPVSPRTRALVAVDSATCDDCLAELRDSGDRRFRYPFINCTNCGPRFTIVRGVPYDRSRTTMAAFEMCAECQAEYENPRDRRFHAQPNACPRCGPRVRLVGDSGKDLDPIAGAARLLADGAIVAVKGLGGYHLAVRAEDERAVKALRGRKARQDKPFAVMVADVEAAERLALVYEEEAELLQAPQRPIVLASRRTGAPVADSVAPHTNELGLMLPYTPLHYVLLADLASLGGGALVMTSGNVSDEPIAYEDEEALARLGDIADAFLLHDRAIHMRTDDSVVRLVQSAPGSPRMMTVRRSRGYVPDSLPLPVAARRPLLACGAELKSTFCLARGERAWVGQHIGDLGEWETFRAFSEGIVHFQELFATQPEIVVHDLHPDYRSTAYALEREGVEAFGVQHHHAHLAAVLAEHGEIGPAVGAIYDGSGYGSDGTVWGGELLVGGLEGFERVGHLRRVPLPGGDRAAAEPWRMACAWVAEATGEPMPSVPPSLRGRIDDRRWSALARAMRSEQASPLTSSVGRLFDAVAALCGVRLEVTYEGQAAIELEALADPGESGAYKMSYTQGELDPRPAILAVMSDLGAGVPSRAVSARFHEALAAATVVGCIDAADAAGLSLVVLAGGVFQNRLLLERVAAGVQAAGLRVLTPERLPPGDGAISFGQCAIAALASSL
jgi:hydrogenase maturation protein HypF